MLFVFPLPADCLRGNWHVAGVPLVLVTRTCIGKPTFLPPLSSAPRCFAVSGISQTPSPLGSGPMPKGGSALVAISSSNKVTGEIDQ